MSNSKQGYTRAKALKGSPRTRQAPHNDDAFDRSTPDTLANRSDQWNEHLHIRAYSPRTIKRNQHHLTLFLRWSHERGLSTTTEITKPILESYQRHLHRHRKADGNPLTTTTQKQRLASLQQFFAWLCKNNLLPANPAADLELPRTTHPALPRGLSREELTRLLSIPDTRDPLGIRDRAILETLYSSAIRRSELAKLDLSDLDHTEATLHIRKGKGGKSRLVPIGAQALHWLHQYLDRTRPKLLLDPAEPALFLSGYGERITPGHLGNWMKRTLRAADIHRPGACHLLRHSCATHMLENGADIRIIQQLLGHAKLDTTSLYTTVAITQLKHIHQQTHPTSKAPQNTSTTSPENTSTASQDNSTASDQNTPDVAPADSAETPSTRA